MIKVAFCICTRNRMDSLNKLLQSIIEMEVPNGVNVSIVIVENDTEPRSQDLIKKFSTLHGLEIRYFLESQKGIAYARNRSVLEADNCDFCCFVDDDQIVDRKMLRELIECQNEFDADAVSGITPPLFEYQVPACIRSFHLDKQLAYGEIVTQAATGCLFIKKKVLDDIDGPFDLRLNFMGGEDYYMTYKVSKNGGVIRANSRAISYEIIPKERATLKYVMRRTHRTANTKMAVQELINEKSSKLKELPRIIIRLFLGLAITIPYYLFSKNNKLKGIIKVSYSLGCLSYICGVKNRFYK